jgi:hypothetical protein
VGAFLKIFDDIKLRDDAASDRSTQKMPDVVMIDQAEFKKRVAQQEAKFQRTKHIKELFGNTDT